MLTDKRNGPEWVASFIIYMFDIGVVWLLVWMLNPNIDSGLVWLIAILFASIQSHLSTIRNMAKNNA